MNISLLAKWRWRLIGEENNLWKEVIRIKYGEEVDKNVNLGVDCIPWFASNCCKDICSIGSNLNSIQFVFKCLEKLEMEIQLDFGWISGWARTIEG
jgi:hypothetical protein